MTFWNLLEDAAWVLSALIAVWLVYDAYRTGRDYDEDFLVHTMEDLGEESEWQAGADGAARSGKEQP